MRLQAKWLIKGLIKVDGSFICGSLSICLRSWTKSRKAQRVGRPPLRNRFIKKGFEVQCGQKEQIFCAFFVRCVFIRRVKDEHFC